MYEMYVGTVKLISAECKLNETDFIWMGKFILMNVQYGHANFRL